MTQLLGILVVALGIGMVIFVHELGHYLCARRIGVRVIVFSLGFGPRLCGFRRGDTDYRISAVPLGGYVRVAGEEFGERENIPRDHLHAKGAGARTLFYAGGVVMNLLYGLIVFILVFRSGVDFVAPEIAGVVPGGAAWEAGLEEGDRVLTIDGKEMYSWENMVTEVALSGTGARMRVQRGDDELTVDVEPRYLEGVGMRSLGVTRPTAEEAPTLLVAADGPAERAGLRDGDELIAIDGQPIEGTSANRILAEVERQPRPVQVSVRRDGVPQTLSLEPAADDSSPYRIGVLLAPRQVVGLRDVPVVRRLGLQRGDVIINVDGSPFYGDTTEPITSGGGPLTVDVRRGGVEQALTVPDATSADREALAANLAFSAVPGSLLVVPQADGPALRAGMLPGDVVRAIDGRDMRDFDDLREVVRGSDGDPMTFTVARGGEQLQLVLQPERIVSLGLVTVLEFKKQLYRKEDLGGAIQAGLVNSVDLIKQLYVTLKRIVTGDVSARNLGGIITISRVTYQSAQWGAAYFFYFLAMLSINLAFINVLPIPVLDGGHLLFVLIEKVKGSPVSNTVLNYSQILGLIFILALIVFVTYNDILRLL